MITDDSAFVIFINWPQLATATTADLVLAHDRSHSQGIRLADANERSNARGASSLMAWIGTPPVPGNVSLS
jgi:hypothetical protein